MHSHSCLPIADQGLESASNRLSLEGSPYYNSKAIGARSRATEGTAGSALNDPIFQPAEFAAQNPIRKFLPTQIRIVSYTVKHTIDA